jgi:phosphatidylinositol glycan class O
MPLCIEVKRQVVPDAVDILLQEGTVGDKRDDEKPQVTVLGFANAYGSTYLLFTLIGFSLLFLVNQLSGQVALGFVIVALLGYLELVDSERDSRSMKRVFSASTTPTDFDAASLPQEQPTFTEIVPLALLGHVAFFATGHQAVLATIQWKAAFVGFAEVVYPVSPMLVVLNTWGPFMLLALAAPLLATWNVSPTANGAAPVLADSLQTCLGFLLYYATLTVSSAASAAWLRRHLMVWKVFAPRFMLAGVSLVLVDLAMLLAIGVGVNRTAVKMARTFNAVTL